nr:SGNH family hydrolase [Snodgrassella alvi]
MPTSKYRRVPSYHNKQKKKYPHVEEVPVVSVKTITTMPIVVESEETETKEQPKKSNKQQFRFVLLVFIITAGIALWLMQNSIIAYYQQTYHSNSILTKLKQYAWWQTGSRAGEALNNGVSQLNQSIKSANLSTITAFNDNYAYTDSYKAKLQQQLKLAQEQHRLAQKKAAIENDMKAAFTLTAADEVFFAGDSLMQGVAPHVQKWLSEVYGIKTINLSKQSTGLTYPGFFNWPQTIANTLDNNPHIKILVMFLGPNDPWDIPDPHNGSRFVSFASPQWESIYRSHIKTIMDSARQHQVTVLWLTPPDMRKQKLNEQMIYLRQITADEVSKNHGYVVDTRAMLGSNGDQFYDTVTQADGKKIKTRSSDGIHFTLSGQKIIARNIFNRFNLPAQITDNYTTNVQ